MPKLPGSSSKQSLSLLYNNGKMGPHPILEANFSAPRPVIEVSVAKDILRAALDIVARYGSHLKRSTIKRERNASKRFKTEHATPPSHIITGFNQVMNALEGGTLSLILACREDLANPQILHHLPFQCRLGGVTLASLPAGASEELQSLLDIPKISLVGFTNQDCKEPKDKEYMEFLNFVQKRVPKMTADLSEYQSLCVRKVPIVTGEKIGRKKDKSSKSPIPSKSSIAPKSSASSSTFSTTLKPPASSKSR